MQSIPSLFHGISRQSCILDGPVPSLALRVHITSGYLYPFQFLSIPLKSDLVVLIMLIVEVFVLKCVIDYVLMMTNTIAISYV